MSWSKIHEAALRAAHGRPSLPTREVLGEWFGGPRPPRLTTSPLLPRAAAGDLRGADAPILHGLEPQGDA